MLWHVGRAADMFQPSRAAQRIWHLPVLAGHISTNAKPMCTIPLLIVDGRAAMQSAVAPYDFVPLHLLLLLLLCAGDRHCVLLLMRS